MFSCFHVRRPGLRLLQRVLPCLILLLLLPGILYAGSSFWSGMEEGQLSLVMWGVVLFDCIILGGTVVLFLFNGKLKKEIDRGRKQLSLQEKKFQAVFQNYQQLCGLLDCSGGLIAVNRKALVMIGCSEQDVVGQAFQDTPWWSHSVAEQEKLHQAINDVLAGRDLVRFNTTHVDCEQNLRYIDFSLSSIRDGNGNLLYMLALGHDVTALRHNRQLYHSFFDNTPDPVLLVKDGVIIDCNRKVLELFQCSREQVIGLRPLDLVPVTPAEEEGIPHGLEQILDQVVLTGVQTTEWQARKFDGTVFDGEWTMIPLDIGGTIYLQIIVKDITEVKKTQRELVMAKYAFDHSTLPIVWYVPGKTLAECRFFYVNDAACRVIGYSREEFLQLSIGDISLVWSEDNFEQILDDIRRQGAKTYETMIRHREGSSFPVEVNTSYFKLENREYFFVIAEEISRRKQLEEELRQAQKMEAIGTLAGGIAHDFNNILSAIFGYTELALHRSDPESEQSRHLRQVRHAAERARSLVQQILTFSRKTGEKQEPLKIGPVVRDALKLLRSSIPTTIFIESSIESEGMVMADATRIQQIVMNLCTNGYHAMRENGGILRIRVTDATLADNGRQSDIDLEPGSYVLLTVSDTGTGMDDETRKRIFDPYFTTKDIGEGTGLGLAVVHGIVQGYNGTIRVQSRPGKGAVFEVYLPRYDEEERREESNDQGREVSAGGVERIMFVDDEELITEMSRQMLTQFGYTVTTFISSTEALEDFSADPHAIDLVITDLTMPAMSGVQLASSMLAVRPDLPIILCTGYSEEMNRSKALELGIRKFIQKPIVMQELLQTVRSVLDGN